MEEAQQNVELNDDGTCSTCEELAIEAEYIQCSMCKKKFHGVCKAAGSDDKWATKSMLLTYKSPSTKSNFMFFCNVCKTIMETNMADADGYRIRKMERNMELITNELTEIKELLSKNTSPALPRQTTPATIPAPVDELAATETETTNEASGNMMQSNIWNDVEKLATVKAKPAESVLIINKSLDSETDRANKEMVESAVIENRIPIKKSFKSMNGNLVVVCESAESRDALKTQLATVDANMEMRSPSENKSVISIVGLTKNYKKEEVVQLLKQNYFLGQFAENNDLQDHIKVFAVKPLKGRDDVFQAFARVSKVVRQGFKTFKDKITMGITTCKIYDQYHVKRCNNCQGFGHFYKECQTPQIKVCANCGGDHTSKDCASDLKHCVNCEKAGERDCEHRADDPKCPTLSQEQDKLKANLNMQH